METDRLLARARVNRTQAAGRGFCKKFRSTLIGRGVRENRVLQAVYTLTVDGKLPGHHRHARGRPAERLRRTSRAPDLVERIRVQLLFLCQRSAPGRPGRRLVNHVHVREVAHARLAASEQEQCESVAGTLQTGDSGCSCSCEQVSQVPQADSQSRTYVSDGDHLLADWRLRDRQCLRRVPCHIASARVIRTEAREVARHSWQRVVLWSRPDVPILPPEQSPFQIERRATSTRNSNSHCEEVMFRDTFFVDWK